VRREQHPAPLLSWSQVRLGQSRIQAQGPTFVQAASQSRAGRHRHRGGKPVSSQPLKRAGAAHAGVGQGSWAAKQALVGCCRLRAGRDEGCVVGVCGQKGVLEKTIQGGSLCPQPLSVTTSSVVQIYIKTILEHKKGHKTRLLYREARCLGWDRATGTRLYRSCRRHRPGSRSVSLGGCDPVHVPQQGAGSICSWCLLPAGYTSVEK